MDRKALIIGIDHYQHISSLKGCVNDAKKVKRVLTQHTTLDEERNFDVEIITTTELKGISRGQLRDKIEALFRDKRGLSLLYCSCHGHIENTGGYLVTSECKRGDDGVSMNEILYMANQSPADNRMIILDCCHAGGLGRDSLNNNISAISEGVTIMAASASNQYSIEKNGAGLFTNLFIHALEGGAANILGEITASSVYSYIDKAMGSKGQRPIFMTNVRRYAILRKVDSQLKRAILRKITHLFNKGPNVPFHLDSSYEPTSDHPDPENVKKFEILQQLNRVNLVIPLEGASHMYYAAMEEKSCGLTTLGKSYWILVKNEII